MSARTTGPIKSTWLFICLVGGLSAIVPLSIDLYLPAFPGMSDDLGASDAGIQLTLTTYLLGQVLGIAFGGPMSDRFGRRRPVAIALALFAAASLACAFAPSVQALAALRVVQGATGGVAVAIGPALVRDVSVGTAAARLMSGVLAVGMIAPVIAPLIGSQILHLRSWRWVFVPIAVFGAVWSLLCWRWLTETLPPQRRSGDSLGEAVRVLGRVCRDGQFVGLTIAGSLFGAAFWAYLSSSSLVFQSIYDLSPQGYSVVFAVNAVGFLAAVQTNRWVLGHYSAQRTLVVGMVVGAIASIVLLIAVTTAGDGLLTFAIPLFVVVATMGFVQPIVIVLALTNHADSAGTAATIATLSQAAFGAAVAPAIGLIGGDYAVMLAAAMAGLTVSAVAVLALTWRRGLPVDAHPSEETISEAQLSHEGALGV